MKKIQTYLVLLGIVVLSGCAAESQDPVYNQIYKDGWLQSSGNGFAVRELASSASSIER